MRKDRITKKCRFCGKNFSPAPNKLDKKYCCKKCFHKDKENPLTRKCPQCHKEFKPLSGRKGSQIYCSKRCYNSSQTKQVVIICKRCGQPFQTYQARYKAQYCSWKCYTSKIAATCKNCGDTFYLDKKSQPKIFCSRACSHKYLGAQSKGIPKSEETKTKVSNGLKKYYDGKPEKHWNFQGGNFTQKRGPTWKEQRKRARVRDNYTCRVCGITEEALGKELSVHHIIPFRKFQSSQKANELSNLICTCQSCHMKLEHGAVTAPTK